MRKASTKFDLLRKGILFVLFVNCYVYFIENYSDNFKSKRGMDYAENVRVTSIVTVCSTS